MNSSILTQVKVFYKKSKDRTCLIGFCFDATQGRADGTVLSVKLFSTDFLTCQGTLLYSVVKMGKTDKTEYLYQENIIRSLYFFCDVKTALVGQN